MLPGKIELAGQTGAAPSRGKLGAPARLCRRCGRAPRGFGPSVAIRTLPAQAVRNRNGRGVQQCAASLLGVLALITPSGCGRARLPPSFASLLRLVAPLVHISARASPLALAQLYEFGRAPCRQGFSCGPARPLSSVLFPSGFGDLIHRDGPEVRPSNSARPPSTCRHDGSCLQTALITSSLTGRSLGNVGAP